MWMWMLNGKRYLAEEKDRKKEREGMLSVETAYSL